MPELRVTRAYRKSLEVAPDFIYHDRAAANAEGLAAIQESAADNGFLELQWHQRNRTSKVKGSAGPPGSPYKERKILAIHRIEGHPDRLMLCYVNERSNGRLSVSWKGIEDKDVAEWSVVDVPKFEDQPADPTPEELAEQQRAAAAELAPATGN